MEYEFSINDEFFAIPASHTSAGFGVVTRRRLSPNFPIKVIASLNVDEKRRLYLPQSLLDQVEVTKGESLLTVRGSRYALGCVKHGSVVEEVLTRPAFEMFHTNSE